MRDDIIVRTADGTLAALVGTCGGVYVGNGIYWQLTTESVSYTHLGADLRRGGKARAGGGVLSLLTAQADGQWMSSARRLTYVGAGWARSSRSMAGKA